jgi:hypothetical protein
MVSQDLSVNAYVADLPFPLLLMGNDGEIRKVKAFILS